MKLAIKALSPLLGKEIPLPSYATAGSAAMDLRACMEEPVVIAPGARVVVPSGIAIALPSAEYVALLFARSGLAAKGGVCLANGVGVIDSDYRGEVMVSLHNHSNEPQTVDPGERIAQMVIMPYLAAQFYEADELSDTVRGAGGFGSTGSK